jgi:hypothetical protein
MKPPSDTLLRYNSGELGNRKSCTPYPSMGDELFNRVMFLIDTTYVPALLFFLGQNEQALNCGFRDNASRAERIDSH